MTEPVSLAMAKLNMRIDGSAEDELIEQSITAAREWVERYTGHLLIRREVVEVFGPLASAVNLRAWPDVTVTRVDYLASGGNVTVDPSDYVVSPIQRPAQLGLVAPSGWGRFGRAAAGAAKAAVVTVTMQAGYAADAVPARFVRAMLVLIAGMYDNRGTLPQAAIASAKGICFDDRLRRV